VHEQVCRKSFKSLSNLRQHEKSKQHQLRLMNGGGDDDFFFNSNNNRQRQLSRLTNSSTVSTTTTVAKTISMPTMHLNHINFLIFFVITSKLCILRCSNCKSKLSSKSHSSEHLRRRVCAQAISVRSMSKALSGARLVGGAQDRGRFGSLLHVVSICMRIRASTAATTLRRRPMFAHSHSRRSRQQSTILNHNKERGIVGRR
jgi:hypothetical protein